MVLRRRYERPYGARIFDGSGETFFKARTNPGNPRGPFVNNKDVAPATAISPYCLSRGDRGGGVSLADSRTSYGFAVAVEVPVERNDRAM